MKNRILSIAPNREFAEAGGLMSYGQNQADSYRRAATYVDKILKGARSGSKALGLGMRSELLLRADKVIE